MKNESLILIFEIFSVIFTSILGTLLHFTYNWSKNNQLIAIFSATNESIWEHLKLLFFPMLISTIIGYFCIGEYYPNFLYAQAIGIFLGLSFIVIFFYTYTGIIGKDIAILDISSFFIATIITAYVSYRISNSTDSYNFIIAILSLSLLLFFFIYFTYFPPKIKLFEDPVSGKFGIK